MRWIYANKGRSQLTCSFNLFFSSAMCASRFSSVLFILASKDSRVAAMKAALSSSFLRAASSILLSLAARAASLWASKESLLSSAARSLSSIATCWVGLVCGGDGALFCTVGSAKITS